MTLLNNFVAVDWRSGKDKCFFFFKDTNTYSRFDLAEDRVPEGYPKPITYNNWHDFHVHAKDLRFGFTSTCAEGWSLDRDILWLFYYDASVPMVCKYNQDTDKVMETARVADTEWKDLVPYFDNIVAGTWWQTPDTHPFLFRFIMKNGTSMYVDLGYLGTPYGEPGKRHSHREFINENTWPGLAPYAHRIITAVQNDATYDDNYLYIFLTENEYIAYNISKNRVETGPKKVNEGNWPGLLGD